VAQEFPHYREWLWSNASTHISGQDDKLVKVIPLLEITGDEWEVL